jgi:hypothetical protein
LVCQHAATRDRGRLTSDSGENWTEALEARAAEGGPEPEHEIDVFDEADDTHPHSATKDRPIADLGSGGRGGL